MQIAQRNMQDGASMLQTADGALQQVNNMLSRIKELAVSAGDGNKTEEEKKIIQNEDKKKPLSDQKLVKKLEEEGVQISRRTVAKYRMQMEIPDASGRKAE